MSDGPRWILVIVIALLVVGLIAIARGRDHHHGDDVGEQPTAVVLVSAT
jgi:hypothetical protein